MSLFKSNPASGIDEVMVRSLKDLKSTGQISINSRTESTIKEIISYTISSDNPLDRILRNPARKNNLVAQIAETVWVISGSRDLTYLSPFLPRAINYSDDQISWRAGYGRISYLEVNPPKDFLVTRSEGEDFLLFPKVYSRKFKVNQVKNVIDILTQDPSSRQAYIVIPIAGDNLVTNETLDTPCTLSVQFLIRNNKLHCITNMRSNDVIFGLTGINYFEWTFLQELVASILCVEVGTYFHNAGSLHIYERHFDVMDKILFEEESPNKFDINKHIPVNETSWKNLDSNLSAYIELFNRILNPLTGRLKESLSEFALTRSMNSYLVIPLLQLAFLKNKLAASEIMEILSPEVIRKDSHLWEGLLKSDKFFIGGFLNKQK